MCSQIKNKNKFAVINRVLLIALALTALKFTTQPFLVAAQSIYSWTDNDGVIHFSSTKQDEGATQVVLPPIEKENITAKIKEIIQITPTTCEGHGGVNCLKGPDIDGSVICNDDNRDSALNFLKTCSKTKLNTVSIILNTEKGNFNLLSRKDVENLLLSTPENSRIEITIRNLTGITASEIEAKLLPLDLRDELLAGASSVDPYSSSTYSRSLDRKQLLMLLKRKAAAFKISCSNCEGVISGTINYAKSY